MEVTRTCRCWMMMRNCCIRGRWTARAHGALPSSRGQCLPTESAGPRAPLSHPRPAPLKNCGLVQAVLRAPAAASRERDRGAVRPLTAEGRLTASPRAGRAPGPPDSPGLRAPSPTATRQDHATSTLSEAVGPDAAAPRRPALRDLRRA